MGDYINKVIENVKSIVSRLFDELANLKIGVVAHSDYNYANPYDCQDLT